jgi:molybdenum cofactor biosynthesis enzyme MoaA
MSLKPRLQSLYRRLSGLSSQRRRFQHRMAQRWRELPKHLRRPQQVAGITSISCGATHGIMEKCNFACTSCYLSDLANHTRPLPFDAVTQQLDELRAYLGPGGKTQITSGEVTLLPPADLGRIIAYARSIGLDPMVMTNGQRLLQNLDYLPTLVRDYGLEKISFHIDTTQKGRSNMPLGLHEKEIHPIRDRFAKLVRQVRRTTGKPLHAAHTVTITPHNFAAIPDLVHWFLDNADSIRLLSLLPVAPVGRTQDQHSTDLTLDAVWEEICQGAGQSLNRDALLFGHPECNITVPLFALSCGGCHRLIEIARAGKTWDQHIVRKAVRDFACYTAVDHSLGANMLKLLRPLLLRPHTLAELIGYGLYRLCSEARWLSLFLLQALCLKRPKLRPVFFVVHKFMSPDELQTPIGRERLQSCVFKLPVEGKMVSMCEMNATTLRRSLNSAQLKPNAKHISDGG